jgi:uncharacterized membrane protein
MWETTLDVWEDIRSSFWFRPACIAGFAGALAPLTLMLDHRVISNSDAQLFWLFDGKADAARELLSVIASSLITVVAVAFSVTLVAVQQAASQYSPRILRNFTKDKVNQTILGTYVATFIYALIVLSDVRSEPKGALDIGGMSGFVPALSVMITMLFALISLGMLVFFIHHVTLSLQVSTILSKIRSELDHELDRGTTTGLSEDRNDELSYGDLEKHLMPKKIGKMTEIRATEEGYVRRIDEKRLMKVSAILAPGLVCLPVEIGEYVLPGRPIIQIWSSLPLTEQLTNKLNKFVRIGRDRTASQDPLFAIRQIVDIAVKALSPGVNDPTTAEECIVSLKGALARILPKRLPPRLFETGPISGLIQRPGLKELVDHCFSQIQRNSRRDLHVSLTLVSALNELALICTVPARADTFRSHLQRLLDEIDQRELSPGDRKILITRTTESVRAVSTHIASVNQSLQWAG